MTEFLDGYTFENILASMLARVDARFDKREGAILYDALAPAALELAGLYGQLREYYKNTFAATASGSWLDLRASEAGVMRKDAVAAERRITFTAPDGSTPAIPIGTQYSTLDGERSLVFTVRENLSPGVYRAVCDTPGRAGNDYFGELQNITDPELQGTATMSDILVEGIDTEDDASLYRRYLLALTTTPYGGNFADYKQKALSCTGVGAAQIYPFYNGGGTVKVVILNEKREIPSQDIVDAVQTAICPRSLTAGVGWAPIGHQCVVKAADAVTISVSGTVTLGGNADLDGVTAAARAACEAYLAEIRQDFDRELTKNKPVYRMRLYWSRIFVALMALDGVMGLDGLKINGKEDYNIEFREDSDVQEVPVLGEVTLVAAE